MRISTIFLTAALLCVLTSEASAQKAASSSFRDQANEILTSYLGIKDALIESNSDAAGQKSGDLVTALEKVSADVLTSEQRVQWDKIAALIRTDAVHISRNKELVHQREHFIKLSNNMYALVSNYKVNSAEMYLHYCPMKKASWLSESKDVRNPYYGSKMLTCGAVKATLKRN